MNCPCIYGLTLGLAAYLLNPEERDYSWERLFRQASVELGLAREGTW